MAEPHLPLRQWFLNPGDHRARLLGRVGGWKVTEAWVTFRVLESGAKAEEVCPKHGQRDSPGRSLMLGQAGESLPHGVSSNPALEPPQLPTLTAF